METKTDQTGCLIQELLDLYEKDLPKKWDITTAPSSLQPRAEGSSPRSLSQEGKKNSQRVYSQKDFSFFIQQIEKSRGRALLYPYLGSGRGKGVYVELLDGSIKMDLLGGVGVQILGHGHKEIQRASLRAGLSDVLMQGHLLLNREYKELSCKLLDLVPKEAKLKYVWLSSSGSMANENALKMVRQKKSPRRKILAFDRAFAGRTTLMSEITSNPKVKEGLPSYDEVLRVPFYDPKDPGRSLKILKSHLEREGDNICAFIFEIVLGEGGYKSAPREFFVSLFEECRLYKVALWVDEVQTFLRTGQFFAFEKWGLSQYIDLCTVGKALQLAATFFTEEYKPKPGLISGTFSATTPALAGGLRILEILEQGYMGEEGVISRIQEDIIKLFRELKEKSLIADYDVFGLMAAFSLREPSMERTQKFLKMLFQNGVIALSCGRTRVRARFLIPAVIKKAEIQELRKVLRDTLSSFYTSSV
ncbi:MAG: aminotransferase class III-fold pyridoxal phosphate-dependent enzyme [Bdellovibrionales bacterium]|nr:aminotransferase class III-fold pyridoxal phosphate-dependent enzyme [Bdellovibrionales bacterium]